MILNQFPDIHWLKNRIKVRKEAGLGWQTVILNVSKQADFRPDIDGPFSLFLNLSGESSISTGKQWHTLRDDLFFLTNQGQLYSLELDQKKSGETFNIHFGEQFYREAVYMLQQKDCYLIDNTQPFGSVSAHFTNRSWYRTQEFNRLLTTFRQQTSLLSEARLEENLFPLFSYLYLGCATEKQRFCQLPIQKKSTRQEIQHRLYRAVEAIHQLYATALTLEQLAGIACLSKFHFLRLFSQAFGLSPLQYVQHLRLERAQSLLKESQLPIQQIADLVGLQNASSLSRLLKQHTGLAPISLRATK